MREPVIVMGMHKCGTTLLAAMVHHGGTAMLAGDADPSYDTGLKYERPLCQEINRVLLGYASGDGNPHSLEAIWKRPLRPFPGEYRARLEAETLDQPWGFKDPRTTITYPAWAEAFPTGARCYVYRRHREFLLRSLHMRKGRFSQARRVRRALEAWLQYNEAVVRNCQLDTAAQRPFVVVSYARLMEDASTGEASLLSRMTQATGVALSDARDPSLHRVRETTSPCEKCFLWWVEAGRRARLRQVYADLEAQCALVAPTCSQP